MQADYKKAEQFILARMKKELPSTLFYHGPHHTPDVMNAAMQIVGTEKLTDEEISLLRVAVAFHDAGFIYVYKDHEEKACQMAKEILPAFGFSGKQVEIICGMIEATKTPQRPKNRLEEIIADADLDYLGRDDVYPIAKSLLDELKIHNGLTDEKKWNEIQVSFLKKHKYHTKYSNQLRKPGKEKYLQELIRKMS
jgi:predicted metal-dependent HD superfamily phosphohydrolase